MIIRRAFLMFHHIRSMSKRRMMRKLAVWKEMRGVCKPGYPGFLYVEGKDTSIREYVKAIKQMRWQSVEVRRNIWETIPDGIWKKKSCEPEAGRLQGPFTVIEVETSEEMSKILRAAGLEEFLRKAMTGVRD
ncbi:RWD domain containing [Arthrobotrys conoides]|uniref:RWD domain containing n=1 Tax=Arthrobotrys conoides TaxID=74498 RepID=A0AAN8NX87_9PEZI